uniref:uncharacterized protein LOC117164769 n=1 Tax=Bombus vancouverensis nearcticus TaxID=2705178 RepID=UPI00143AA9F8|nr:uncharacterized protein LOC117164769 [Bombus vancouverensis nearcticus]
MHSNVEPKFMCDHCGKRLKLKIDLVDHIEKTHLNARHVCKICEKNLSYDSKETQKEIRLTV